MYKRYSLFKRLGQRGQSILMVALSLPIFMFLLAIVFDVGMYFVQASKLQNAADSAALAGVAVYTNNCTTKLIGKPSSMTDLEKSFETTVSGDSYTFDSVDDKADADSEADDYIKKNRSDLSLKNNADTGLWYSPIVFTLVDKSTASYTGLYCYRVDLKENLDLTFARFFGLDDFDVTASAIALAIPTAETKPDDDDIDEFIKVVNASIYKTAPNLYWESIYNSSSNHKYKVTTTDVDGNTSTDDGEVFGAKNDRYFTTTINDYTSDSELSTATRISDNTLAWKEGSDPFCAEPITGTDKIGLKTLVYTINTTFVQGKTSTKKEATSIYIDRPNTQSGGLGTPYRACTINITGDKLSDDEDTPLYMRVESEPILVNGQAMLVQPLTVNIKGNQKKPMIVAYDGPDPNRGFVDTPSVDVTTGMVYKWISQDNGGGYWSQTWDYGYGHYDSKNLVLTSSTVSAPITINLDHDFRGVIYCPYSKVYVYGSGAIDGFILAPEIEDHGTSSTRKTHTTVASIPNWGASYDGGTNWFKYEVESKSNKYNVIYDTFANYTWTNLTD